MAEYDEANDLENDEEEDTDYPGTPSGGSKAPAPLAQLRNLAYGGESQPNQDPFAGLGGNPINPNTQWLAFKAGALKPTTGGGFGESLSNAYGAMAGVQSKEAELRAKYLPLVSQAAMMRQLQQAKLDKAQFGMTQGYHEAAISSLTGLLSRPEPLTKTRVAGALGSAVENMGVPADYATQLLQGLPDDPDAMRNEIQRLAIGRLKGGEALKAVTPQVEMQDTGAGRIPANLNTNAPLPVGAMPGGMGKSLAPGERYKTGKDQAGAETITDLQTGQIYYPQPGQGGPQRLGVAGVKNEEARGKDLADYETKLDDRVGAMRDLQARIREMRSYVQEANKGGFRTGASAELRSKMAAWAKDLTAIGMSTERADAVGKLFAGGDFSNAQAFNKLATQGAMEALGAAMDGGGRRTQAEFLMFARNSPSIELDPAAMDKMLNFSTKQYLSGTAEQRELNKYRKDGGDLRDWPTYWTKRAEDLGYVDPAIETGTAKGSITQPLRVPATLSNTGKRMYQLPDGRWSYTAPK